MIKHKWILVAVLAAVFTFNVAGHVKCAQRMSMEDRINRVVDAYQVENVCAELMFLNYMHYYLDEMIDLHIDEPDIKVELAPTGAQIGLQSMMRLFKAGDRSKVPSTVGRDTGSDNKEVRGAGTPSEAMIPMGRGEMHIHEMNGMVIEVAEDGQTAQVMFNSTGKENSDWAWIKYGIDCKKNEDGIWKMWHVHVYGTTGNSYFKDWAETKGYMNDPGMAMMMPGGGEAGAPGGMPGMEGAEGPGGMPGGEMPEGMSQEADRESVGKWVYTGGTSEKYESIPPLLPIPPEPAKTWDPEKAY